MKKREIIGFQYWWEPGSGWQIGTTYSTLNKSPHSLEEGREKFYQYASEGHTIASWWEGTRAEAAETFPQIF